MIEKVYEELVVNAQNIAGKLNVTKEELTEELGSIVQGNWKEFVPSSPTRKKFMAVDGGEFVKELRAGTVFVLNAEALITEGINVVDMAQDVRSGVFRPGNKARERVGELMNLMELKLALENGEKVDWILMDGSVKMKLGDVKPLEGKLTFEEGKINSLKHQDESIMLTHLVYEKQVYMARLLSRYGTKLAWISKMNKSRDLFRHEISDIAILETLTVKMGRTPTTCRPLIKGEIDLEDERRDLENFQVCSFYARLEDQERVLRIDVMTSDEEGIQTLMNDLYHISVKGYPYPLVKVHFDVKISYNDRSRIIEILNLKRKRSVDWWPGQFY
ncbi:DNA double-strand break repair nuclease NurA [Metallosphaera tengchongensis]|uniref:DNA double-strand break repair nuclease NurA n=1 Tax=Metallosphaera tengchongensis TaxID=1532350 RepID=A0A6N0NYH5_9CREN|nr:DNA double-strand break repair nuclease NurA [Metallosphaera tengchongensis]QKR00428.1 DNA double-strand break repair nuclease NurA [Metallosphaera tengchongensis]